MSAPTPCWCSPSGASSSSSIPDDLADTVRAKVVVDGRNCLDTERWTNAGWRVYCLGKSVDRVSRQTPA